MNILHIALWDLIRVIKDKQAAIWLVIMPIFFAFIFGSVYRGPGDQAVWVPVVNLDGGELSEVFAEAFRGEGYNINIRPATDEINVKNWPASIVIPATFTETVMEGETAYAAFVEGRSSPERALAVQARLMETLVRFTTALVKTDAVGRGWTQESKTELRAELAKPQQITVHKPGDARLKPPPSGFTMSVPAFLVMFVLQMSIIFGGTTLLQDRVSGAFARLAAAPVTPLTIFMGKTLARTLQAAVQAIIMLGLGWAIFSVSLGDSPWALLPVVFCFALCVCFIGIFLGMACSTEQQVVTCGIIGALLLSALGGCWWPIEITPPVMQSLATFLPTYWALRGMQDVMYFNRSFEAILPACAILLAYAAVFAALCYPFARNYRA